MTAETGPRGIDGAGDSIEYFFEDLAQTQRELLQDCADIRFLMTVIGRAQAEVSQLIGVDILDEESLEDAWEELNRMINILRQTIKKDLGRRDRFIRPEIAEKDPYVVFGWLKLEPITPEEELDGRGRRWYKWAPTEAGTAVLQEIAELAEGYEQKINAD